MRSRAAILHDVGGPWAVEDFELDSPKRGEVLVRMVAAGLCHTDDHLLQGDLSVPNEVMRALGLPPMFPTIGGHEGAGIVIETGSDVPDLHPGDHVVMSFVAVCGRCRWCASGQEYICDQGAGILTPGMPTDGTFRHHTTGGHDLGHIAKVGAFSEYTVVSRDSVVKINEEIPLTAAALLSCAIPTGYGSAANRANITGGDTAVVIGAGGIGSAAIQGARINGAAWIVAVDPVELKRKTALQFGATHAVPTVEEAFDLVRELTEGVMAEGVVLSPSLVDKAGIAAALKLTAKGGRCVLTGMASQRTTAITFDMQDFAMMNKTLCGTVFGSCNPRADIPKFARLYQSGRLQLDAMITRRYSLDDINQGYADLRNGEIVRGIIDFTDGSGTG